MLEHITTNLPNQLSIAFDKTKVAKFAIIYDSHLAKFQIAFALNKQDALKMLVFRFKHDQLTVQIAKSDDSYQPLNDSCLLTPVEWEFANKLINIAMNKNHQ